MRCAMESVSILFRFQANKKELFARFGSSAEKIYFFGWNSSSGAEIDKKFIESLKAKAEQQQQVYLFSVINWPHRNTISKWSGRFFFYLEK